MLEAWRRDYNEEQPHSKLGWMTPGPYASALGGENGRDTALRWAPRPGFFPRSNKRFKSTPDSRYLWIKKRGSRQYSLPIETEHGIISGHVTGTISERSGRKL